MASVYGNGLMGVYLGTIAGDGGPATTWVELGDTFADSMNLTSAEGTKIEFFTEEKTNAFISKTQAGSKTLTWTCVNISAQNLQKLFGGTVTGAGTIGDPYIYRAPVAGVQAIERSIKVVNGDGVEFIFVRASVFPTFNIAFSKSQASQINITATILAPTKANQEDMFIKYPGA